MARSFSYGVAAQHALPMPTGASASSAAGEGLALAAYYDTQIARHRSLSAGEMAHIECLTPVTFAPRIIALLL